MSAGKSHRTDEDLEIARLTLSDRIRDWWARATGPIHRAEYATLGEALCHRVLLWVPVVLPPVVALLAVAAYVFTGWRAQDLASKAVTSAEAGNFRLAAIQIESARQLRAKHPSVVKAQALVTSMAGDPSSAGFWTEVAAHDAPLSSAELATQAEALVKFGSAEQQAQALADLDAAGLSVEASVARARLAFQSGSLADAVLHARDAVATDPSPSNKLLLARALVSRHRPFLRNAPLNLPTETRSAIAEASNLIDALVDTPQGNDALALGLLALTSDAALCRKWARRAWQTQSATNPALLPAASWLVASGEMPRDELIATLRFIFAGTPLPQRALLAEWLMTKGEAQIVLDTISARDAAQHPAAFVAYTRALARKGNWDELLASASKGASVPEPVRLVAVAYAAKETRRSGMAEKATLDALKAAAGSPLLGPTLVATEGLGFDGLVDENLVGMCADAATAGATFAAARERFERTGRRANLELAYEKARSASPAAESVADYGRYVDLLAGRAVDPAVTGAALAANARNPALRITHALALMKAGRPDDAFRVFDDFTLFFDALSPSAQAVVVAIWAAKGDSAGAGDLARRVDTRKISRDEQALMSSRLAD